MKSVAIFGVVILLWIGAFAGVFAHTPAPANRPNIVLMFPDNLGWGEVNVYGGVRGPITPRLDRLAAEGLGVDDRAAGKPFTTHLTRKLSLESPSTLIVDVIREGVLGGSPTTRSIYRKG